MKWIITSDEFHDGREGLMGTYPTVTKLDRVQGKSRLEVAAEYVAQHAGDYPYEFRLLDDDGEVYYVGRCGDINQADGDHAFHPMDCFEGEGVTTMEYRQAGTEDEWVVL